MPITEFHDSPSPSPLGFAFSMLNRRRDQIHSMDAPRESNGQDQLQQQQPQLEAFQRQVSDRLHDLCAVDSSQLLSLPWLRKLLEAFLSCQEDFRLILINNRGYLSKPPMEKYLSEFLDRSVKALDVCNAIRDGIDQIRQWEKLLEIVLCALDSPRSLGEGQFRRAKKALDDLAIGMLDDRDNSNLLSLRNRSFGRSSNGNKEQRSLGQFRSLSWSVSRNWSAARQLQAISNNLVVPKGNDISSTNGLSLAVFTISYVLLFVMWALVAAIPCQDRGLQTNFPLTKQFSWAIPILSLHERILEESKKRDRRNACGLLREIHEIEICARNLNEVIDNVQFPLSEDKEKELKNRVQELGNVRGTIKDGIDPFERQIRDVFHRIVKSRTEGLDSVGQS